jgi:hypothetical protein
MEMLQAAHGQKWTDSPAALADDGKVCHGDFQAGQ